MERRGSGLTRIMESYNDYEIKPKFTSDVSSFKVIFPNKGYIKKSPVSDKKSPVMSGNVINDNDYFLLKMYKMLPSGVKRTTYSQVQRLFEKYTYKYEFRREDVEEIFKVKKSRASEIIAMLLTNDLIMPASPTKYKFKK